MRPAKQPAHRKDLLAAGYASESYNNTAIKTTQDEWERIFGPTPSPRKVAQSRLAKKHSKRRAELREIKEAEQVNCCADFPNCEHDV